MSLTRPQMDAIFQLHNEVVIIREGVAFDANENEITYDINAVNEKVNQNEIAETAAQQAQATAKASALAKLTALGLTADEVKALVG